MAFQNVSLTKWLSSRVVVRLTTVCSYTERLSKFVPRVRNVFFVRVRTSGLQLLLYRIWWLKPLESCTSSTSNVSPKLRSMLLDKSSITEAMFLNAYGQFFGSVVDFFPVGQFCRDLFPDAFIACFLFSIAGTFGSNKKAGFLSSLLCASFREHARLLNRDMVLMIKDRLIAWYASRMSLVCRSDKQDGPEALLKLSSFYKQGDILMEQMGNNVIDAIKMVEPHCTFQISLIAHNNRQLIPVDSAFKYRLASSLDSLSEEDGVDPSPLFDIIKNENVSSTDSPVLWVLQTLGPPIPWLRRLSATTLPTSSNEKDCWPRVRLRSCEWLNLPHPQKGIFLSKKIIRSSRQDGPPWPVEASRLTHDMANAFGNPWLWW